MAGRTSGQENGTGDLDGLLIEALKALARCGEREAACMLAARACVQVRREFPGRYRRFDATLHVLTNAYRGRKKHPSSPGSSSG